MDDLQCPHCGMALTPIELPEVTGWSSPFHLACMNDDCPYYRESWRWLEQRFGVKAGYRYRLDPETGKASPLPVWSPTALKDHILDAEVTRQRLSPVRVSTAS